MFMDEKLSTSKLSKTGDQAYNDNISVYFQWYSEVGRRPLEHRCLTCESAYFKFIAFDKVKDKDKNLIRSTKKDKVLLKATLQIYASCRIPELRSIQEHKS